MERIGCNELFHGIDPQLSEFVTSRDVDFTIRELNRSVEASTGDTEELTIVLQSLIQSWFRDHRLRIPSMCVRVCVRDRGRERERGRDGIVFFPVDGGLDGQKRTDLKFVKATLSDVIRTPSEQTPHRKVRS